MNKFLQTRSEIDICTKYLQENGLEESGISAKNWEVSQIIPYMKDGNWIDLGSAGGVVLQNLVKKNISGLKVGIDLAYEENHLKANGIDLIKGDLMNVPFPDSFFNFITSLSVLEHQVDFEKFAHECSRLLSKGGTLFISCDYWPEKYDTSKTKLYSLDWNILSKEDLLELITILHEHGLEITSEIDWTLQDAVINPAYCSPCPGVEYTFFVGSFIKK